MLLMLQCCCCRCYEEGKARLSLMTTQLIHTHDTPPQSSTAIGRQVHCIVFMRCTKRSSQIVVYASKRSILLEIIFLYQQ